MAGRSVFRKVSLLGFPIVLAVVLCTNGYGKTVNKAVIAQPTDNLQTDLDAAGSGTVTFVAGTYNITTPLNVHNGETLVGASGLNSHLTFNLPGGDAALYGLVIDGNAKGVTIEGLDMMSNHGLVYMATGTAYTNISITANNLEYGGGSFSNGTLVFGISDTIACSNLQITYNYFHDSPNTVRNWCIFFCSNSNFDHNLFYNINDGGQLVDPGNNISASYNYGSYLHRMGQEISMNGGTKMQVTNNVFFNWVLPYYDSEGVSVVNSGTNVTISNCFFELNIAPGSTWGQPDPNINRFGYAIEASGTPGTVSNCTIVAPEQCACFVCADTVVTVKNVDCYGASLWGNFDGEPGPNGYGSCTVTKSPVDPNTGDAPPVPANTFAGPQFAPRLR